MSHAHVANFVHCIFSTKNRQDLISRELQPQLYAYVIGTARNLGIQVIAVGGTRNHIHLLLDVPPVMALSVALQKLKANSSRWMGSRA